MKFQVAVSLIFALAGSACVSTGSYQYDSEIPRSTSVLNEVVSEAGETRTYELNSSSDGSPTMNVTLSRMYEVAVLGVHARSIDGGLANGLGMEPWSGVFLDTVSEGTPAEDAGLLAGDVLLKIGEQAITNRDQFSDHIAEALVARDETTVTVSRLSSAGKREEVVLAVTLGAREVQETSTDTVYLEAPEGIEKRTGMQLATISSEFAKDVWGEEASRVYVCEVVVGSPAYLAGIRRGDRMLSFGGEDVNSAMDVLNAVEGDSRSHAFKVYGEMGAHEASLHTVENLDDDSSFTIPIIVGYSSKPNRTRVSFLEFIFQFGFNYTSRYYETDEREPAKKTDLSILPLGMFEFERSQTKSTNTIFWLIRWSTNH